MCHNPNTHGLHQEGCPSLSYSSFSCICNLVQLCQSKPHCPRWITVSIISIPLLIWKMRNVMFFVVNGIENTICWVACIKPEMLSMHYWTLLGGVVAALVSYSIIASHSKATALLHHRMYQENMSCTKYWLSVIMML